MLDNIIGVEEAGEILGLSPGTVKNYCNEGKLAAQKIGKTWVLDRNNLRLKYTNRDIRNLNDVYYNGVTLSSKSGVSKIEKGIYSASFANVRLESSENTSYYTVTWDLKPLFDLASKGEYEWRIPHGLEKISKEREKDFLQYIETLEPYNKKINVQGKEFIILSLPTLLWDTDGVLYRAGAQSVDGEYYYVLWNVCNLVDPIKIEKASDPNLRCKKCLKYWSIDRRCVDEAGHDYVRNE
ncbi:helix-turn-helix domain-containing protein [Halalkalibacterium halodurans]|uniref:Helix-turn-helix domain-containing protein n=1 Tax=Halalkalibacterium halodurans TaxID=86665 RepID=A0A0M0KNB0_ALKHA|nr:helix-turn-helix domain-containing protein [Halalkalibacterium halodurans]TPE70689.1 helix-turn-helix domain-containing protein [Halalkalibacterium halodurans]